MPATAGRVRMPANNRVHSSAALQTHGIWQSAIGYDPYSPAADSKGSKPNSSAAATENAYASFQGLLSLARITGTAACNETRGACKKCGRVGHLTYQCRNFLSLRDDGEKKDDSAVQAANAAFEKIKKAAAGGREKVESESDKGRKYCSSSLQSLIPQFIEAPQNLGGDADGTVGPAQGLSQLQRADLAAVKAEGGEREGGGAGKLGAAKREAGGEDLDSEEGVRFWRNDWGIGKWSLVSSRVFVDFFREGSIHATMTLNGGG